MSRLPRHWRLVRLEDLQAVEPRAITDGPFGSHLTRSHYTESGPRVIRLQNIGDGIFHDRPAHISQQHFQALRDHEVLPGDLLIASLGETLPRACLAPHHLGPAIVKADCIRVRLSSKVDGRWVMYAMQRPGVRKWAEKRRHGVGRPRLGLKVIREIPVPLAPLSEQLRIVAILEDHLSRLDKARSILLASQRRIGRWMQSVIDNAFCKVQADEAPSDGHSRWAEELSRERLAAWMLRPSERPYREPAKADLEALRDKFPWPVVSLEAVTDPVRVIRYGILKPKVDAGSVKYVEVKDLAGNTLQGKVLNLTSRQLDEQFSGARLESGDVAIAVRGSYERVSVVPDTLAGANISRDVARLAPLPSYEPLFLYYWLQSSPSKAYLNRHARGVAVKGVNIATLRVMPVPVVRPDVQRRVVSSIDAQLSTATATVGGIDRALARSRVVRSAVLAAAFSGRLTGPACETDRVEVIASG